jgi:type III restriction enzyme
MVIKVPTGGGKTLLAVEAIREYQTRYAGKRTGLVVWVIPTETIYSQTIAKLKDKANPLRQFLDQSSGNRTLIVEKGQRLSIQDIEENLVILFIMIQSISRKNAKESLKMFQDAGGFEEFFPADHRYDLHEELLKNCPNLDSFNYMGNPVVKTSMGNAIRVSRPLIIIDEIHKVFSNTAKETIDGLNPVMVLGLTATPKKDMNILVSITGLELKDEEMIKLDMHIIPPENRNADDWKSMLVEITKQQKLLEKKAKKYQQTTGVYIRPIALIQAERTGKEQRGKGFVHSLDIKEHLQEIGINPDEVSIKSSSQNDIEDVDLLAQDCNVRYIIT